jgi:hypothetical protein
MSEWERRYKDALIQNDIAIEINNLLVSEKNKLKEENEKLRLRLHDFCGLVKRSGATGEWSCLAEATIKEIGQ